MADIKSITLVTNLDLDKTPVINLFKEEARSCGLEIRVNDLKVKSDLTIFVGNGVIHKLLLSSYFRSDSIAYWALESYTGFENNSKIMWLTRLQYLVNWRRVQLILPLKERLLPFATRSQRIIVFKNVPKIVEGSDLNKGMKTVDFIHYGELDDRRVYTKEILKLCSYMSRDIICIGRNAPIEIVSNLRPNMMHFELMEFLKKAKFGFVGYRPLDFNSTYCAPSSS
jgi:hypothetical protein